MFGLLWAAAALSVALRAAHGGKRPDYSRPSGDPRRGLLYFLTTAMRPGHKESVRNHPLEFMIGVLLHLSILLAFAGILRTVVHPTSGIGSLVRIRPLLVLGLGAGAVLFLRRLISRDLRAMSAPDDYLAILASGGLLLASALVGAHPRMPALALYYAALLLVYLPLGKLRHAVFFFAARADYGRRLGHRGVYPPPLAEGE